MANALQIPRYTPLRDDETELPKLAVNPRSSPILILVRKSSNQNANLLGDLWSPAEWPESPAPIETEAGAVPADHGFGFHEEQDVVQRDQHWWSEVQKSRSQKFNFGRGRFRFNTATCCRRASTSRAVSLRLRRKTRMATRKERMISNTNPSV